ncbi:methyltransferase [Amylibacter marinus]|uniref:Methyltransferase n=1 Tax=Amylibacter marinus TaxID=1475483 RepID=A0ABQ5VRT3_9RHOB|nr:trimethylamine methyltransferase family protein [Amylibacter marinus]GLQ34015.1 methyltransferase [Amylibacter marinus]
MNKPVTRRSGGRDARRALRRAPLAQDLRPIRAGLAGGTYKPLSDIDVLRIHRAALDALEQIGLADAPQSGIDAMTKAGATLGDDGRLRFPRALVEDMLDLAAKEITLFSRDGKNDLELSGNRVHYGTAGAAVHLVDPEHNDYRDCTVQDLFDAAKIANTLDNVHFFQRPMVCRDIVDNYEMDLNTIYACARGTTKHIGTSFSDPSYVDGALKFVYEIAGGEDKFRARPFISNTNCFVVPPMKFATESSEAMEKCIHGGMPILLLSAGQSGATAPASIAGAIVQAVAECLAGIVYVNSIAPGHPAIFGTWPFVSDLRTGAMSGGSGEQALLTAGCAQMHKYYGIPGGAAAGIADSKLPDMQAGYEQAQSNVMAGLAGLNMVYESVGMHASLLGFCLESMIIGNDMLGQALRAVRGIDVSEDNLSIETMRSVCEDGPGHYLGSEQTLNLMQTEYVYPEIADRSSPKEWMENQKPLLLTQAIKAKRRILSNQSSAEFPPELDAALRKMVKIHLD